MKFLVLLMLISFGAYAAPQVREADRGWQGLSPVTAGAVTTQLVVTQSTVVTVTVPDGANQFIYTGDGANVCDDPIIGKRCSATYPTTSVSQTGWIKVIDNSQRTLPGNNNVSTSYIYLRSLAVSNTTHNFEWSKY